MTRGRLPNTPLNTGVLRRVQRSPVSDLDCDSKFSTLLTGNRQYIGPMAIERYHPYQQPSRVGSRDKMRDTTSSSEWRTKETPRNKE
ncbi:hypothetical protein F2Q69_00012068 [Brassica cretica]|uniref:Uncharacterized protein n=1 Tax=Brassica cretica TaxID=69181 RepID=A0A8S9R8I9_BRACR|nr:hypothetical protein F2Q69_00012068 [Brassica cretica]